MKPEINFVHSFDVTQPHDKDDERLFVSGFSVHAKLYEDKGVEIPREELQNIANTLIGAHLMKDHSMSVDDIVGRIRESKVVFDDRTGSDAVKYCGFTYDENLNKKINRGLINNVSIGFTFTPICSQCGEDFRECPHYFDEAHLIAKDIVCHEQSFVTRGADATSTVESAESFKAQFDYKKETNFNQQTATINEPISPNRWTYYYSVGSRNKGENMKMEEMKKELAEKDELISQLSEQKTELEETISEHETKVSEFKDEIAKQKELIEDYESRFAEIESLRKEAFCKEILAEEIEKGITSEDKSSERLEKLMAMSEDSLSAVREVVEASKKITGRPGEFDNNSGSNIKPITEFDSSDKKSVSNILSVALRYPERK